MINVFLVHQRTFEEIKFYNFTVLVDYNLGKATILTNDGPRDAIGYGKIKEIDTTDMHRRRIHKELFIWEE